MLVDGVTKINEIRYENPEDQQAENYRKMLLTMARDVRVILIKLADRLHNMRTIDALALDRQKAIAEETMIVYAPLAHRFGVAKLKWELEDLSFKTLQPADYASVAAGVNARRAEREESERRARVADVSEVKEPLDDRDPIAVHQMSTDHHLREKVEGKADRERGECNPVLGQHDGRGTYHTPRQPGYRGPRA